MLEQDLSFRFEGETINFMVLSSYYLEVEQVFQMIGDFQPDDHEASLTLVSEEAEPRLDSGPNLALEPLAGMDAG